MNNFFKKPVIYQSQSGAIELKEDIKGDAVWATQEQIVQLFNVHQSVISRHINKIFDDKEVDIDSNMQKMHITSSDKPVNLYSLDVILAVGYRTNSKVAVAFRKWATSVLQKHIQLGFTINKKIIANNYDSFIKSVEDIKKLLVRSNQIKSADVLELVKIYACTWLSIDAYDKKKLPSTGKTKKQVKITSKEFIKALKKFQQDLKLRDETGDLFGVERDPGTLNGIIGNIYQSLGKKDAYSTIEEKAAHLLYFMVKNHPFVDGNKRNGAFAFVWFLNKNYLLDINKFTPDVLTTLTLLTAESDPKEKDRIIGLIMILLNNNLIPNK